MTRPHDLPRRGRKRILVVDDETDIVEMIAYNLERNGFEVITANDGVTALELAHAEQPDLIILDLMLPGVDGTEVARRLKGDPHTSGILIIMLTAKGEETDVVVGLTLGADDYVTKPFSMKILLARLNTVLRRADQNIADEAAGLLKAGPLEIDTARYEVRIDKHPIPLTVTEFKLLAALAGARGRVLSRDQLLDKVMGEDVIVTDRTIDVHVTAIRRKLGDHHWVIRTIRGVGYRFQESPEQD